MDMAGKLDLMGSRIIAFFCIIVFLVCQSSSKQSKITEALSAITTKKIFTPDTIINGKLKLNNYLSSEDFYPSIKELNTIEFIRESPVIAFCNISKSEYLLAYQYEGSTRNAFDCFEIGYYNIDIEECITLNNYSEFNTESGLRLGITLDEVTKIKGSNYLRQGNKIVYKISYDDSPFLQYYNMPEYFLECELLQEKVILIKFGFTYP